MQFCNNYVHFLFSVYRNSMLSSALAQYPDLHKIIVGAGSCSVCEQPYIGSWLECVYFQPAKKVWKSQPSTCTNTKQNLCTLFQLLPPLKNNPGIIPLRVTVCSYKCFNAEGHEFYGVADTHGWQFFIFCFVHEFFLCSAATRTRAVCKLAPPTTVA